MTVQAGEQPESRQLLLRDFDHWFTQLPLRLPGVSREHFQPLRERMRAALGSVTSLTSVELEEARQITSSHRDRGEFVVTLDGGIYFSNYDFSFAMTRAVTRVSDVVGGKMIRVAREGFGQFWAQVAMLRHAVDAAQASSIVVCDDGLSTGQSLAEVLRQLSSQYLDVARIDVLVNPRGVEKVADVPVRTLYFGNVSEWNHERDFFWGSPTGGISLLTMNNINALGGIPYSFSSRLLSLKLGAPATNIQELRRKLLEVNIDFWALLTEAAGRPLRLRDCKRLRWLTSVSEFTERTPMEEVIRWFAEHDPDPSEAGT